MAAHRSTRRKLLSLLLRRLPLSSLSSSVVGGHRGARAATGHRSVARTAVAVLAGARQTPSVTTTNTSAQLRFFAASATCSNGLERPAVIYQSNHLLAVYKPPGWHSIPNGATASRTEQFSPAVKNGTISSSSSSKHLHNNKSAAGGYNSKCLLTYLTRHELGGGSTRTYLKPLHRLDQPCSGILLLGKTTKAASRVQSAWKDVDKTYYVVVILGDRSSARSALPQEQSTLLLEKEEKDVNSARMAIPWTKLSGYMVRRRTNHTKSGNNKMGVNKGWSVTILPCHSDEAVDDAQRMKDDNLRYCELEYRRVIVPPPQRAQRPPSTNISCSDDNFALLEIRTHDGARHMIRALLASYGMVVAGDGRYRGRGVGAATDTTPTTTRPAFLFLPDQSVALHAHTIALPPSIPLGETLQRSFVAPIPALWSKVFGWTNRDIQLWQKQCRVPHLS